MTCLVKFLTAMCGRPLCAGNVHVLTVLDTLLYTYIYAAVIIRQSLTPVTLKFRQTYISLFITTRKRSLTIIQILGKEFRSLK